MDVPKRRPPLPKLPVQRGLVDGPASGGVDADTENRCADLGSLRDRGDVLEGAGCLLPQARTPTRNAPPRPAPVPGRSAVQSFEHARAASAALSSCSDPSFPSDVSPSHVASPSAPEVTSSASKKRSTWGQKNFEDELAVTRTELAATRKKVDNLEEALSALQKENMMLRNETGIQRDVEILLSGHRDEEDVRDSPRGTCRGVCAFLGRR